MTREPRVASSILVVMIVALVCCTLAPADVIPTATLYAWYKADSLAGGNLSGSNVLTWNDSSPTDHSGTASTVTTPKPQYNAGTLDSNDEPYVTMSGTSYLEAANNIGLTGDLSTTVFLVWRPASIDGQDGPFSWGNTVGTDTEFGMANNALPAGGGLQMQYAGSQPASFTTKPSTSFQIIQVDKTPGTIKATTSMWLNGVSLTIDSADSSGNTPNVSDSPLFIGSWGGVFGDLNGDIAEVVVYNGALNSMDANTVGSYLASKYGISSSYIAPEPTSLALLGVSGVLLLRRRRA